MTYAEIISKVAESTGLSYKLVDRTYKAYWRAVREYVSSLPLTDDLTDEELVKVRPNVNVPSLGKLYVAPDRYRRLKFHFAKTRELKEKKYVTHQEN